MNINRREYSFNITLNNRIFTTVIIDSHYEIKHPDINDQIILLLLEQINGSIIELSDESNGFKYFAQEIYWNLKPYRIILTYCEEDFLGVINAFRIKEKNYEKMAKSSRH